MERTWQAGKQGMLRRLHGDVEATHRRVVEEERAEQIVMRQLHHLALAAAVDALGAPAAGAVQREPLAAVAQPVVERAALRVVRVGPGNVAQQQIGAVEGALDVVEAVADGRALAAAVVELLQQLDAGVVHVVASRRAERKAADDEMRALGHWGLLSMCSSSDSILLQRSPSLVSPRKGTFSLPPVSVPGAGIEPAWSRLQRILSPRCLPVSTIRASRRQFGGRRAP